MSVNTKYGIMQQPVFINTKHMYYIFRLYTVFINIVFVYYLFIISYWYQSHYALCLTIDGPTIYTRIILHKTSLSNLD